MNGFYTLESSALILLAVVKLLPSTGHSMHCIPVIRGFTVRYNAHSHMHTCAHMHMCMYTYIHTAKFAYVSVSRDCTLVLDHYLIDNLSDILVAECVHISRHADSAKAHQ